MSEPGFVDQASKAARFTARLPLVVIGRLLRIFAQVIFAIFVLILHPQIKWLAGLIARSAFVQQTVKPALRGFVTAVYEPYFAYLSHLSPLWATVSIGVPLAILEPAKFLATLMIAVRPKMGIILWFALQGLSLILIDRTWKAVRPQSRKIWIVSRLHAWVWLNAEYGKYWLKHTVVYRTAKVWKWEASKVLQKLWRRLRLHQQDLRP
jgi:hypothetical protein